MSFRRGHLLREGKGGKRLLLSWREKEIEKGVRMEERGPISSDPIGREEGKRQEKNYAYVQASGPDQNNNCVYIHRYVTSASLSLSGQP